MVTCEKCVGTGVLPMFMHIDNGVCFRCEGSGEVEYNPTSDNNAQVCEHCINLYKADGHLVYHLAFWVWDAGTGKESAGTGHWHVSAFEPSTGEQYFVNRSGICEGNDDIHGITCIPVSQCRVDYKGFLENGFVALSDAEELAFIKQHLAPHFDSWAESVQMIEHYMPSAA